MQLIPQQLLVRPHPLLPTLAPEHPPGPDPAVPLSPPDHPGPPVPQLPAGAVPLHQQRLRLSEGALPHHGQRLCEWGGGAGGGRAGTGREGPLGSTVVTKYGGRQSSAGTTQGRWQGPGDLSWGASPSLESRGTQPASRPSWSRPRARERREWPGPALLGPRSLLGP